MAIAAIALIGLFSGCEDQVTVAPGWVAVPLKIMVKTPEGAIPSDLYSTVRAFYGQPVSQIKLNTPVFELVIRNDISEDEPKKFEARANFADYYNVSWPESSSGQFEVSMGLAVEEVRPTTCGEGRCAIRDRVQDYVAAFTKDVRGLLPSYITIEVRNDDLDLKKWDLIQTLWPTKVEFDCSYDENAAKNKDPGTIDFASGLSCKAAVEFVLKKPGPF
jgi:hypothetical protein